MRLVRGLLPVAVLLLLTSPVWAGGDRAPAPSAPPSTAALDTAVQQLLADGAAAYERADYDKAYALLSAAWKVRPDWQIAATLGPCALKLGKPVEAATVLAVYAREAPADRKEKAAALLAEATATVGTVVVTVDVPDAELLVDGVLTSAKPGEAIYVEAELRHKVAARKGDVLGEVDLVARAGRTHNVSLTLGTPAADTGPRKEVVIAGAAVGGAALIVGVATGIAALGASDRAQGQLEAIRASGTPCKTSPASGPCADLIALRDEQSALTNAALWSFVGAGAVGISTVIYVLATRTTPPATGFTIAPAVGSTGGGVAITGRF